MGFGPSLGDAFTIEALGETWYSSALSGPLTVTYVPPPPVVTGPSSASLAPGPLPWLVLGGVEVGNSARVLSYLENRQSDANPTGVPGISSRWGVTDTDCICPVLITEEDDDASLYVRPDLDPAPWYDASVPESASFLGVYVKSIEGLDSIVARAVTERGADPGGAYLGPQRQGVRRINVKAMLIATSCEGLAYGRRWLTHQLANPLCTLCATRTLDLRTVCPGADAAWDTGLVRLESVGTIEGPKASEETGPRAACDYIDVEWTFVAEDPWIYEATEVCLPETQYEDAQSIEGQAFASCTVEAAAVGNTGAILTVRTLGNPIPILSVVWMLLDDAGDPCTEAAIVAAGADAISLSWQNVPPNSTLVIDGSRGRSSITSYIDGEDGLEYVDATSYYDFSLAPAPTWPSICEGQVMCIGVYASEMGGIDGVGNGSIAIDYQRRYLA